MKYGTYDNSAIVPTAVQAEQSLLGALILQGAPLLNEIRGILGVEDFYIGAHRMIWDALLDLDELDEPIDLVTVTDRLRDRGTLVHVEAHYVASLPDLGFSPSLAPNHARLILKKAIRRRTIVTLQEAVRHATDTNYELEEVSLLIRKALDVIDGKVSDELMLAATVARELAAELQAFRESGEMRGFETGIRTLDTSYWFKRTDFNVIAGRPGTGKTHLGNMLARNLSKNDGAVLQVNLEMAHTDNLEKQAKAFSVFDQGGFQFPAKINQNDFDRMLYGVKKAGELPIYYTKTAHAETILSVARAAAAKYGIRHVVIDYLQIVDVSSLARTRVDQLTEFTRKAKRFALRNQIPIWGLAQIGRADKSTRRKPVPPTLADLKGSGSIEEDADNVLLMHIPDEQNRELIEWIYAKGRHKADKAYQLMRKDFDRGTFIEVNEDTPDQEKKGDDV